MFLLISAFAADAAVKPNDMSYILANIRSTFFISVKQVFINGLVSL